MSRPTDYDPKYNEQARKLCLLGATDKDLADFFEVCEATINNWKISHPSFLESLKKGKQIADANIVESLYNRAMGYTHKEVKLAQHEGVFTDQKIVDKHYPPDPVSMIFWLKNRQPDKWREKQQIEQNQEIKINIDKEDLDL